MKTLVSRTTVFFGSRAKPHHPTPHNPDFDLTRLSNPPTPLFKPTHQDYLYALSGRCTPRAIAPPKANSYITVTVGSRGQSCHHPSELGPQSALKPTSHPTMTSDYYYPTTAVILPHDGQAILADPQALSTTIRSSCSTTVCQPRKHNLSLVGHILSNPKEPQDCYFLINSTKN